MTLRTNIFGVAILLASLAPLDAWGGIEDSGSIEDPVPPNIMFLIDNSSSMASCWDKDRTDTNGDGLITDADACSSSSATWRIASVVDAIAQVVPFMDNAYFGLAVTDPNNVSDPDGIGTTASRDGVIVPLGTPTSDFLYWLGQIQTSASSAGSIQASAVNAVPLAESLDDLREYYENGDHTSDPLYSGDSPIDYYCQESHIVLITDGVTPLSEPSPDIDKSITGSVKTYAASPDEGGTPGTEGYYNQYMDNVASYLANTDLSVLANNPNGQHVLTHVLVLDNDSSLLESTATNGGGVYGVVDTKVTGAEPDDLVGELYTVMNTITEGTYVKAAPTLSSDGGRLYLGYYEIKSERPLYYGYLASYIIQNDPTQPGYGQLDTSYAQPAWEAGEILASRWVGIQDTMDQDNNGEGWRDIYTNIDDDPVLDPFDASNMLSISPLCELMLDTSFDGVTYPGIAKGQDVDKDGDVDLDDCKDLMDFIRGYYLAEFVSTGQPRGHWKLGDIRHSQVAIADHDPKIFTRNPYLRQFIAESLPQTIEDCPYSDEEKCVLDVVFVGANDGMVHAFAKNNGDELWAYIPRNILGEAVPDSEEISELLDLMNGQVLTNDVTPRVEFVWIDGYQGEGQFDPSEVDGEQRINEWARVLLVGQGAGGRTYTALDITDPQHPWLLWEDTNDTDPANGIGHTTSTAVAGVIYDQDNTPGYDRWVAFYGSGHEEDGGKVEARLYIKAFDDLWDTAPSDEVYDDEGIQVQVDLDGDGVEDGTGFPSNPTAVDKDNDGDIDEVFLVNSSGAMYKFVIDTTDINASEGCLFFDPEDALIDGAGNRQYIAPRTSSYYAATAAFNGNGQLILYWGTGSPYDLFTTDYGYFYAVADSSSCTEGVLYTECNSVGFIGLRSGEKLTGSPVVYASNVYFTTFTPAADRCNEGEARLYGMNFTTCEPALDTNADGIVDASTDDIYMDVGTGIPSAAVIANDTIYVATSGGVDGSNVDDSINSIAVENDPFSGTVAIQWREMF